MINMMKSVEIDNVAKCAIVLGLVEKYYYNNKKITGAGYNISLCHQIKHNHKKIAQRFNIK